MFNWGSFSQNEPGNPLHIQLNTIEIKRINFTPNNYLRIKSYCGSGIKLGLWISLPCKRLSVINRMFTKAIRAY